MEFNNTFTLKQLKLIAYAPAVAANGIAMIDGEISEQETLAISGALLGSSEKYRHNKLITLAITSFSQFVQMGDMPGEMRYIKSPEEYLRLFRLIGKTIDKNVKSEIGVEYKEFLIDLMRQVASASRGNKRKSLFGRGSNVTAEEEKFIEHIADIMNVSQ